MKPKHIVTKGIVLSRTDYQEADRILTVLTPDHGKLRLIAKGVRRPKSKLAGGIELFSVNDITVLPSQRDLKTLISSRLHTHYGGIITDINRTMLGYNLLKQINRVTEDEPEEEYFMLMEAALKGLNDDALQHDVLELWFTLRLLTVNGHTPDLRNDTGHRRLSVDGSYGFDFDAMSFVQQSNGPYTANHIKLLRLAVTAPDPTALKQVQGGEQYVAATLSLAKNIAKQQA